MTNVSERAELCPNDNYFYLQGPNGVAVSDGWYAACTRSNYEYKIAQDVRSKGISHYLPGTVETRQWKDRRKELFVPLFPGYVFTRFADNSVNRLSVLKTPGVVRFLAVGSSLQAIPDHEIEAVRMLLASRRHCFPHPFLRDGCWVRVRRGALAGLEGTLIRHRGSSRLVISIDALSQSVATELDAADVEPIHNSRLHTRF
jgi:transcription antitermination factor NusG